MAYHLFTGKSFSHISGRLTTIIILLALVLTTGCSKNGNSTVGQYYMKATVAGSAFDAEGLSQANLSSSTSGGINYTYLAGKATDGRFIKITFITNTGVALTVGTYPLNTGIAAADYYPKGIDSSFTYAASGSVVLTQLVPNLVGTFNFTCADTTMVSNGSFSIRAQ